MGIYKLKGKNNIETGNFRLSVKIKSKSIQRYSRDYDYLQGLEEALLNLRDEGGSYEDAKKLLASYSPSITPNESKLSKTSVTAEEIKTKISEYLAKRKNEQISADYPYVYIGEPCGDYLLSFYLKHKTNNKTRTATVILKD